MENKIQNPGTSNNNSIHASIIVRDEAGILRKKIEGYHTPSIFAEQHLFYPIWGNEYTCRAPYKVERKGVEFYFLFRISTGYLYFKYEGEEFTAKPGDVVLLDGRKEHTYYAENPVTFMQICYRGNESEAYYQLLKQHYGVIFHKKPVLQVMFSRIISELGKPLPDDHLLSANIHSILSSLAVPAQSELSPSIAQAQQYILNNFSKNITVEDIAEDVSLSKYHFSRQFKAETGYTPHEYLFDVRIRYARKLLAETNQSIESVSINSGFANTSSFIRAFKKETMVTPAMFRKFFDPSGFK